ncbi:hypothetical protein BDV96DRAFT_651397 [Lophiotrema nucula]|uniref:SGNH hydrolase-type esterase domain-containing protein n=1 Tax=Lophiotrema nucula TaxID=690887 RepID=A0A6A5YUR4_9PLEO|nr:hypothetical protein BDV96DRAFT_651397 [Lophiotrema nucula]
MGRYFAGMWLGVLGPLLLWQVLGPPKSAESSTHRPTAPSWSWASLPLHRGIHYAPDLPQMGSSVDVDHNFKAMVTGQAIGSNPFDWVTNTILHLRAKGIECDATSRLFDFSGSWDLNRGDGRSSPKFDCHTRLFRDRVPSVDNEELLFVYIGNNAGFGLRKTNNHAPTYERVGFVNWIHPQNEFLESMKVVTVDVI